MLKRIGLIILIAGLAYLPALSGGFVFDDDMLLTENDIIRAPDGLYRIWFTTEPYEYYPISYSTLWFAWRLWGMNPMGYHAANLILHAAGAILIWLILRKLSIPGAFLAALIFAVHPVNVESVAWISQWRNTMAMLFFLLSILCYVKFLARARVPLAAKQTTLAAKLSRVSPLAPSPSSLAPTIWYWLSLAMFILAMLSKGSAAVLPVVLLGIIWWQRSQGTIPIFADHAGMMPGKLGLSSSIWRDIVCTAPFFVIAILLTGVNVWFQTKDASEAIRGAGLVERLLGAGAVVWFYLYKALLPINLAFVYPQWNIDAGSPLWWLPLLAALTVTVVLWRYRTGWGRGFLFAWGFFCAAFVPVMGFTDLGYMQYSLVADHYQHIAIIGVITLVGAGWSTWQQRSRVAGQRAAIVIAITAVGILALLTWRQAGMYSDEITLNRTTLEINPDCWMAYNNLGVVLADAGRLPEAIDHFQQALSLRPEYTEAHNNMGQTLFKMGRIEEAIQHYQQSLRLKPNDAQVHFNLGAALAQTGRIQEAIKHYQQTLALKSDHYEAHNILGAALFKTGQLQEAIEHFKIALQLKFDYYEAHYNLGTALVQIGRSQEAVEHYRQALRLHPDFIQGYTNLALIHAGLHQSAEAIATAQKALDLARTQGHTEQARNIEDWLNSYKAGIGN